MTEEQSHQLDEIHRALFSVPPGSPKETKPLIEGMRIMWMAYQRGSWVVRAVIWILPAVAGVGIAWEKIMGWIK